MKFQQLKRIYTASESLPSRERGLKWHNVVPRLLHIRVAPFAGAWIEIVRVLPSVVVMLVAPFAGAWIEMRRSR